MAEVVEAETTPIFCRKYPCLYRRRPQIILRHDGASARLPAMQLERWENPILRCGVGSLPLPQPHDVSQHRAHCHGLAAGLGLGLTNLTVKPGAPDVDLLIRKIQIMPLQ